MKPVLFRDEQRTIFLERRARAMRYLAIVMVVFWSLVFASIYHYWKV